MKKRIMGMLVMLVVMGVMGAMPVMAWEIYAPDGYLFTTDEKGVIQIGDAEALIEFSNYVNYGYTSFYANAVLTKDIKLNEALNNNPTSNWETWGTTAPTGIGLWTPIGNMSNPYSGTFDGAGYTISGIYIKTDTNAQGLFGQCTEGSNIKNLKITESYLKGANYTGGIAGLSGGTIMNCQVAATVVGKNDVGGVVGLNNVYGSITSSSFSGSVAGVERVGGIAGKAYQSISNSYNTGSVEGKYTVGGIAGEVDGSINNCYNTGSVSGLYNFAGGIAGRNSGSLANCFNTGNVSAFYSTMGGIVGDNTGSLANCYYRTGSAVYGEWGKAITANGIGKTADNVGQTEAKTAAAFSTGEVAWRLQNGQSDPAVPVWGQQLTVDARPLLKTTDKICQVIFQTGNGIAAESIAYVNQNGTVTPPLAATGYAWQDGSQGVFTADSAVTGDIAVRCGIAALPTATASYGSSTKLGDIEFVGGSVPAANWSWADADKETVLLVGNSTAYPATYTPVVPAFDTKTVSITPVITPRSLSTDEVTISQPANARYTGAAIKPAITVTDSAAAITADDYTVSYTNNTSPGTATVTITGQGNYQGEVTRTFTITSSGGGGYTPPGMSGITVTPHALSFDPSGQLVVDISGLPVGATVFYSLDGSSYTTTPPAMTRAGEQLLYLRISCPGYQDFTTQTTVTVAKQLAPEIPTINAAVSGGQPAGSIDLAALLPADRGLTRYQLGPVNDPGGLLNGAPTIDANGVISYGFRHHLAKTDEAVSAAEQADDAPAQGDAAGLASAAATAKTATITVLVSMENYEDTTLMVVVTEAEPFSVRYLTHIQDYGWETNWVTAGALSGTSSQSKRLEALKVELTGAVPAGASIETAVHVQNLGDLGPFAMGTAAGTSGQGLRLENICLTLTNLPGYSLRYNVHVQNQGWLRDEADSSSWFSSGEVAGTAALGLRLEGIRMVLVKDE